MFAVDRLLRAIRTGDATRDASGWRIHVVLVVVTAAFLANEWGIAPRPPRR